MYFADTATVGADQTQNAPSFLHRHKVAKSFADYGPALDWVYPTEAGVGYWPGSTVRGSGTWIDHPQLEGVLYMANRPIGTLDYARQAETFALTTANTLYVVPPDVLAQSATGTRSATALADELKFYDWNATNNGGIEQTARGLSYDPGTGYVWIYYPRFFFQSGDAQAAPPTSIAMVLWTEQISARCSMLGPVTAVSRHSPNPLHYKYTVWEFLYYSWDAALCHDEIAQIVMMRA